MCGIVGYISLKDDYCPMAKSHFRDYALTLDSLRGEDSTGIMLLRNEFDLTTAHTTSSGRKYVTGKHYEKLVKDPAWAFIGHNRAATAGSVKIENAHPFTFGDVTMVHNGTLVNRGASIPSYQYEYEVDSMQIAYALSLHKPEEVPDVLKTINGSFCIVWTDARDQSINVARNSDRPFHFCFNKDKKIMWFMSDGHHLNAINASLSRSDAKGGAIYQLDKYKHLKFKKGSLVPEVTKFDPFAYPVYQHRPTTPTHTERNTAIQRAGERWGNHYRTTNGKSSTLYSTSDGKVRINGERRKLPHGHIDALKQLFDVDPDELVAFDVEEWVEIEEHKCMVQGNFYHRDWGNSTWPMVLYGVPLVVVNAYNEQTWAVKIKGITECISGWQGDDIPSVLGELYSYDAGTVGLLEDYELPAEGADEEDEDDMYTGKVVGPEGRMVDGLHLMKQLADGCAQCNDPLEWEHRQDYMYVNEGRDILCDKCIIEMEAATG